ncbi:MAG: LptF/LptG family permease [Verrucomicrobiota bacterium]
MKIYFRYLLLEMLKPLGFCLVAIAALLIVVDLYGSLEEFNEHKASFDVILKYYLALVPSIIRHMLPVSILFATLYTLLNLSRRSEITALTAGGMGPVTLFAPFITVAGVCAVFLFVVMAWPATQSDAARAQIMEELRTGNQGGDVARNVIYVDPLDHHVWHIKVLNEKTRQARDLDVLLRDHKKNDWIKYVANEAEFNGEHWNLRDGRKFIFEDGSDVPKQQAFDTLQATELTTPAMTLAFVQSEPHELTFDELFSFLFAADHLAPTKMAQYQTQFWYLMAYPASIFVLLLFALTMGISTDRRTGAAAGVFNAIFLLLAFVFVMEFFLALGRGNRLSPFLGAWLGPVLFAGLALVLMGRKYGWFWHLERIGREWLEQRFPQFLPRRRGDKLPQDQLNLRLKSLQLLLDRVTKKNPSYQGSDTTQKAGESAAGKKDEVKAEDLPPALPENTTFKSAEETAPADKKVEPADEPPALPKHEGASTAEKAKQDAPPRPEPQGPEEEMPTALSRKKPKAEKKEKEKVQNDELPPALPAKDTQPNTEEPPALPKKASADAPPPLPARGGDEAPPPLPTEPAPAKAEEDTPPPLPQKFSTAEVGEEPPPLPPRQD